MLAARGALQRKGRVQVFATADPLAKELTFAGQGRVARGKSVSGVMVRGVLPSEEMQVSEFGSRLIEGSMEALKPGEFGVVIGSALAWKLDLSVGSPV